MAAESSLEQEALKRREKLKALREKSTLASSNVSQVLFDHLVFFDIDFMSRFATIMTSTLRNILHVIMVKK